MSNVNVINHPLIQNKLAIIRDQNTGAKEFRELVEEIAMLMAYEVTRNLPVTEIEVETPVALARCHVISRPKIALIPILRAGLGMVEGVLKLIPTAKVGHIGVYRDPETLQPIEYYCKLPSDIQEWELILLDPMLATGGSASAAIQLLKQRGGTQIRLMSLIAAPEGIQSLQAKHPDVDIYVTAIDDRLNSHGYIVPGLGDAGDRLFGTK
ncbi:MAG TPA: uracil phosphoribosyltransferase [Bacillota bacterium]|nr:uracil phosphoribosyltransferase [Bacillota bacterium]